jgi:hypothetical protein
MNIISSETRTIRRAAEDLVEIVYYDHAHVTLENLKKDLGLFDTIVQNDRVKKLIVLGLHTKIDLDARKKAAEENRRRKSRIIAEAFVVRSTAIRLAINMYILFLNKEFPVKVFPTSEKALEWLSSMEN